MHSFVPARRLVPALLTSVVALGAVAGTAAAAGTQTFDSTVRLQCDRPFYGPILYVQAPPNEAFNIRVRGTAPATTAPGETVQLTDVSATAQLAENPGRYLPADYDRFNGYPTSFPLNVTGATPSTIPLTGPGILNSSRTADSWTPAPLGSFADTSLQTAGTDPVIVTAGKFNLNFKIIDHSPYQLLDLGPYFTCSPAADAAPLVTVANTGAPVVVATPVVKSVGGSAIAKIGGLVQVRGTNLAGAKSVTIGTRRVSPLLSTATTVWVWAPPLAKGSYLVSVTTAAGTSAPVQTARVTYR